MPGEHADAASPAAPRLWSGVWAVLKLVPRAGRFLSALIALLVIVGAVAPVAFTIANGHLIGALPGAIEHGLRSPEGTRLWMLLALVAGLFLLQYVAQHALIAASHTVQRRVDGALRERVIRASLAPVGIGHLEDPNLRDVFGLARNLAPTGFTPGSAARGLAAGNTYRVSGLLSAVVVATYSPLLAAALLAAAGMVQAQVLAFLFRNVKGMFTQSADLREATYYRDLALTPPAAKEVRVFGLLPWIDRRYVASWRRAMEEAWAERRRSRAQIAFTGIGLAGAQAGALLYVGLAGVRGELDLEAVAVLMGAALGVLNFGGSDHDLAVAYGAAAVPSILAAEEAAGTLGGGPIGDVDASGLPEHAVVIDDLAFGYPGSDTRVFDGLHLTIPAGQRLAIVGLNGAGKTSLVKLLCRLYEPDRGIITVDGIGLRDLEPASWRRQVAALFQDFTRYDLTALENVAWASGLDAGDPASTTTAHAAAGRVGALSTIESLPEGWNTVLSPQYAGGTDLSGGQWQRIALARALAKVTAGAQLLILDEPTANLDVRGEAELYDRFIDLTAAVNRERPLTTILISHRFSTVRRADRIVVLEEGRVIEDGSHDELMAVGGRYAALFNAQASRFAAEGSSADLALGQAP